MNRRPIPLSRRVIPLGVATMLGALSLFGCSPKEQETVKLKGSTAEVQDRILNPMAKKGPTSKQPTGASKFRSIKSVPEVDR